MAKSINGEVAKELISRFPDTPTMTLAKKLYAENPILFSSLDNARCVIRYHRGQAGEHNRKHIPKENVRLTYDTNPYKLPATESEERKPFILPKANNNILLISDLHIPYHSIEAITAALDYGKKMEINTIFINGDLLDFYKISRFSVDPRQRSVKYEFDSAKSFLRTLRQEFPNAGIYWAKGNHDVRYEHYLMAKAPEIFDDPYYSLEERLRLNEEKVHLIGDKQIIKAGKLSIHHGHLMFRGVFAPVNIARGLFLRAKQSMIVSHTHKESSHTETNLDGEITTCWSTGCLCDLSPDYAPFANSYCHGFAHIQVHDKGYFSVNNLRIYKGKIL